MGNIDTPYELQTFTLRALGDLEANGAYDPLPVEVRLREHLSGMLYVRYQGNSATGRPNIRVQFAPYEEQEFPAFGGWWDYFAMDADALVNRQAEGTGIDVGLPAPGIGLWTSVVIPVLLAGARWIRCPCAELGDIVNPGECEVVLVVRPQ